MKNFRIALLLSLVATLGLAAHTAAAQTPGGTIISNQATATYTDGTNPYTTVSNTVTVTVADVSGLAITPDDTSGSPSHSTVVNGQTNVVFTFTVTNLGNFPDEVSFLSAGGSGASPSIQATGMTITNAAIDVNTDGSIDAGDTSLFNTSALVDSASIPAGGTITVLVAGTITASSGSTVSVTLGDATTGGPSFDNQPGDSSSHEVETVTTGTANGQRQAKGTQDATVAVDAEVLLTMTAPSGPVALGSNITYTLSDNNPGSRTLNSITLANAPGGSNTGIFIIAPIPAQTSFASGQTMPAGTLYTTSPLTTTPQNAVWTTTAPGTLSTITRVAFNVGSTLAVGASTSTALATFQVTISPTANASNSITEIADTFATNSLGVTLTDQSGDAIADQGSGNANFTQPLQGQTPNGTTGLQQVTTLIQVGNVLNGPKNNPGATGPTSQNDDFTNMGLNAGIATVAPGGVTTAGGVVTFTNTVQNTGNANDTYTLTAPTVPAGFTVAISINGGGSYTTVSGGGSVALAVSFGTQTNYLVQVTVPSGQSVLTGFGTTIRATLGVTPANHNDTIDRVYTGFVQVTKTATVANATGIGSPTTPVSGAVITYAIAYSNISSTLGSGTGDILLPATNFVITENGATGGNNWATFTTEVVGSASDTNSGVITGDTVGSNLLTDTLSTLAPGGSGTFTFKRTID